MKYLPGQRGEMASSMDSSIEKICEFLKTNRRIQEDVVERFRNEKMDANAVMSMSNSDLKEMGLIALGDILSLKKFVEEQFQDKKSQDLANEKKRLLQSLLNSSGPKRKLQNLETEASKKKREVTSKPRKVLIGWFHYNNDQKRYIPVREPKGGGTRQVEIHMSADASQVISIGKDLFFPNGISGFGPSSAMTFGIANSQQNDLSEIDVGGLQLPFTLHRYAEKFKPTRLRLYLTSKRTYSLQSNSSDLEANGMHDTDLEIISELESTDLEANGMQNTDLEIIEMDSTDLEASGSDIRDLEACNATFEIDNSDSELDIPVFEPKQSNSQATKSKRSGSNVIAESLEERRNIISEQDKLYQESLEADRDKEMQNRAVLAKGIADAERQEKLRVTRSQRVPDEPQEGEAQVQVRVLHLTEGLVRRAFKTGDKVQCVYDWIGSLSPTPEHFHLAQGISSESLCQKQIVRPSQHITDITSVLFMAESDYTPEIEEDVNFKGFGLEIDDFNTTVYDQGCPHLNLTNDTELGPVSTSPPEQLLEDDNSKDSDVQKPTSQHSSQYDDPGMQFRQVFLPAFMESRGISNDEESDEEDFVTVNQAPPLGCSRNVEVHRTRIKEDLLHLFADPAIMQQTLDWRVIDDHGRKEEGVGSGVQRDIFATFWQRIFSSLTVGDIEKVPCIRHDHQKTEWEAIGRILAYGFKRAGYIPVCLSPVFLASCLYGEDIITEEELLTSFTYYVTADERETINNCLSDKFDCHDEDLLDLLASYKCFRLPTKDNIKVILTELAHQEIIQKPRYIAHCWAPIIGTFKAKEDFSSVKRIKELFLDMTPNAKKVIKALQPRINTDAEKQSFDFLKRFIKSLDAASLKIFLKFITGSDVLTKQYISVSFTVMDGIARRPIAHTCGPLLEVPSTYQTYTELSEEFNNILREKESWNFNIV